jgi:hypothetical protein
MEKMDKQTLGLAAEFAVASELCRRKMYAQLTLGLHKKTDLLVEKGKGMLKIQVKGKNNYKWPAVKGFNDEHMFLILIDYYKKKEDERPDYYILNFTEWRKLVEIKVYDKQRIEKIFNETNYNLEWKRKDDGKILWKGIDIKLSDVNNREFKERWDKIKNKINSL